MGLFAFTRGAGKRIARLAIDRIDGWRTDLDYQGFTRLFHAHGGLSDFEFDLCRRFYELTRSLLPLPDLIIHLTACEEIIHARLASRQRINIASAEDTALFNQFLDEWLVTIPVERLLRLDVSNEGSEFAHSMPEILARLYS